MRKGTIMNPQQIAFLQESGKATAHQMSAHYAAMMKAQKAADAPPAWAQPSDAAAIRLIRERLGLTVAELAQALGASRQSVYRWMKEDVCAEGVYHVILQGVHHELTSGNATEGAFRGWAFRQVPCDPFLRLGALLGIYRPDSTSRVRLRRALDDGPQGTGSKLAADRERPAGELKRPKNNPRRVASVGSRAALQPEKQTDAKVRGGGDERDLPRTGVPSSSAPSSHRKKVTR